MRAKAYVWLALLGAFLPPFVRGEWQRDVPAESVRQMRIACREPRGWEFRVEHSKTGSVEEVRVRLMRRAPDNPPEFKVAFSLPQKDIRHVWTPGGGDRCQLYPDWSGGYGSELACSSPLMTLLNDRNENRLTIACSEALRPVSYNVGLREEGCLVRGEFVFFLVPEAPVAEYEVTLRLDARPAFWSEAAGEAAQWIGAKANLAPAPVNAAAYEPVYSTWYQFHQDVFAECLESECALAAGLGMKTLIVDDGWQTDDTSRGYAYCGDWQVSPRRFPNMRAHVDRVHAMGLKYMLWYALPFVGEKSSAYGRFEGKCLARLPKLGVSVLDPRFPEVREFIVSTCEEALRAWDVDGFKFDFIDRFAFKDADPAVAEAYAGRDVKLVPQAVDLLLKTARRRLEKIKPDLLFEFRQPYLGPAILQYGTMLRASDCPGDLQANRMRVALLRVTAGRTPVHSDMLEWNGEESAEDAARTILAAMFGVVQYSVKLSDLPDRHMRMLRHWLSFLKAHRDALLKGRFRPYHPESCYPVLVGESECERIVSVYEDVAVAAVGRLDRDVYLVNATGCGSLVVELDEKPTRCEAFDAFGNRVAAPCLAIGCSRVPVPRSGYLRIGR